MTRKCPEKCVWKRLKNDDQALLGRTRLAFSVELVCAPGAEENNLFTMCALMAIFYDVV